MFEGTAKEGSESPVLTKLPGLLNQYSHHKLTTHHSNFYRAFNKSRQRIASTRVSPTFKNLDLNL